MANLKENKNQKKQKEESHFKWFITIFITTFILSIIFSYISTNSITNLSMIPAILILILVIIIGIVYDIIGVAVTVAKEEVFHARASEKIKGSKTAVKLIRNSAKVANICADVIGDICGVLSGAISAIIALKLTNDYGMNKNMQFILSALVASLTVGGKAIGKNIAQKYKNNIVGFVGKIVHIFDFKNK